MATETHPLVSLFQTFYLKIWLHHITLAFYKLNDILHILYKNYNCSRFWWRALLAQNYKNRPKKFYTWNIWNSCNDNMTYTITYMLQFSRWSLTPLLWSFVLPPSPWGPWTPLNVENQRACRRRCRHWNSPRQLGIPWTAASSPCR